MQQTKCPNCGGYKTQPASVKKMLLTGGAVSTLLGMALTIFIIGIPFVIAGVGLIVASLFFRENGKMRCRTCAFTFIQPSYGQL